MKLVGKCSILRMKPKRDIEYPLIRLPKEYKDIIGKEALIYEIDKNKFLILIDNNSDRLYNQLYNQPNFHKANKNSSKKTKEIKNDLDFIPQNPKNSNPIPQTKWEGWDSNPGRRLPKPPCYHYTTLP